MDRRTILTIALLALIALATQLAVWILRPRDSGREFVGPLRSDYTLSNFTLDALDEQGRLSFTVIAPRLTRREDDGSIYVIAPDYVLLDNSNNVWKGKSDSAWINKDGTIMKLEGHVEMHRQPTATVKPADLVTTDLTTWPKDKRMETATLVTMSDPDSILRGIGMKADLSLKVMELLSNVHATLQPKHSSAPQK